jgi:hypothetical protein
LICLTFTAAYLNLLEIMRKRGAGLNVRDENLETPLHYACLAANSIAVKFLLQHRVDANLRNSNGLTPLELTRGLLTKEDTPPAILDKLNMIVEMLTSYENPRILCKETL